MATSPVAALPKMQRLLASTVWDGVTNATSGSPTGLADSFNVTPQTWQRLLHFERFTPGIMQENLDTSENIGFGSYERPVTATVPQRYVLRPTGTFVPRVGDWRYLLPWIMNAPGVVDAVTPGFTTYQPSGLTSAAANGNLVTKRHLIFDDSRRVHQLNDVAVMKATFTSEQAPGDPTELKVDIEMLGKSYTLDVSFPEADPNAAAQDLGPSFLHAMLQISFTGLSTPIQCRKFSFTVEYEMNADRFHNSYYLTEQVMLAKKATVAITMPYGIHSALFDLAKDSPGIAMQAKYIFGTRSLVFDCPAIIAPPQPLQNQVPAETYMEWVGTCHAPTSGPVGGPNVITQTGFRIHNDYTV